MGYQRDMQIEKQTQARLAGCVGCRDIKRDGISFRTHTCGQKFLTAREAGLHGADFDQLSDWARGGC
jgi:hypothetical protein